MYAQTAVFIIIFLDPLVRLFSNFACRILFLLRIFWDHRRQNRLRLKFFENFWTLSQIRPKSTKIFFRVLFCLGTFLVQFFTLIPKIAVPLHETAQKKSYERFITTIITIITTIIAHNFFSRHFHATRPRYSESPWKTGPEKYQHKTKLEKKFWSKKFGSVHLPSDQNLTKIFPLSDFVADGLKRCAIKNEYDMQSLKNIHRAV